MTDSDFRPWFRAFIREKNIQWEMWAIKHKEKTYYIDSDVVYEAIMGAPDYEQKYVQKELIRIYLENCDASIADIDFSDLFYRMAENLIKGGYHLKYASKNKFD